MKNLNQYIQEKYLIDVDTNAFDLEDCFDNREPDYVANGVDDLLTFDSDLSDEIPKFIKNFTHLRNEKLYIWKYKYSNTTDYNVVANASQYRRIKRGYEKKDITKFCNAEFKKFGLTEIMILIDKKDTNIIPEIWIINKSKPEYCLYIEPQQ